MSRLKEQVLTMVTLQCNLLIKECAQNIRAHAEAYMYVLYVNKVRSMHVSSPLRECVCIHVWIRTPTRFTGTHVR